MEVLGMVAFVLVIGTMAIAVTGCVCLAARIERLETRLRENGVISSGAGPTGGTKSDRQIIAVRYGLFRAD